MPTAVLCGLFFFLIAAQFQIYIHDNENDSGLAKWIEQLGNRHCFG